MREGSAAMSAIDYIAMALLIIGGLNWAMVGLFDVDVVATVFGAGSPATRLIYVLVGISAAVLDLHGDQDGSRGIDAPMRMRPDLRHPRPAAARGARLPGRERPHRPWRRHRRSGHPRAPGRARAADRRARE
jgi:uncharacterized membrane protein YuzA (DUF378 family)